MLSSVCRLAALAALCLATPVFGQAQVKATFSAPSAVSLREPVVVTFMLENSLSEPIGFDLGSDRTEHFVATTKEPDGTEQRVSLRKRDGGVARLGRIALDPGKRYTQQLVLNNWLPLDRAGDYEVAIELQAAVTTATGMPLGPILPGSVRVRVTPLDTIRLRQVCERLAATIVSTPNSTDRGDAVRALRHVVDNSAIPCVAKVLAATDTYDSSMMALLVQIGTPEGRALIEQATLSRVNDRATIARGALDRFVVKQ